MYILHIALKTTTRRRKISEVPEAVGKPWMKSVLMKRENGLQVGMMRGKDRFQAGFDCDKSVASCAV